MKECIILAGGFGTRLQTVVKDVPKCMAEVAEKPFISYLFDYLIKENFDHVILSLGYKSQIVLDWLENRIFPFKISYVIENEPLGTGGGIRLAFNKVAGDSAYTINGDTFFDINTQDLSNFQRERKALISLALKPMKDFDRYGSVELDENNRIVHFNEKKFCEKGLINGGIYLINKEIFSLLNLSEKFSFEKDVMEAHIKECKVFGKEFDNYFIDIGIPSDFEKANKDFKLR